MRTAKELAVDYICPNAVLGPVTPYEVGAVENLTRLLDKVISAAQAEGIPEGERREKARAAALEAATSDIRVVFDGPPGPESGRFVECENGEGHCIDAGDWRERPDGLWELIIRRPTGETP